MSDVLPVSPVVSRVLEALTSGDPEALLQLYAADAVHEFPYAQGASVRRLEGREMIESYMRGLHEQIIFGRFENVRVWEASDGTVILEADGHHTRPGGENVDIRYMSIIEFRDGLISHYRDYMGPLAG